MSRWLYGLLFIIFASFGIYFWLKEVEIKKFSETFRNYVTFYFSKDKEEEITLYFTGDVILARSVNFLTVKSGDFNWPFKNLSNDLRNSDLTIINLESPLTTDCPLTNEGFIFCGDKRHVLGLSSAGVDIVGLANNHLGDYGEKGISQTIENLDSVGIGSSGVYSKQITYKEVKGTKFSFLAFNSIGNEFGVLPAEEIIMKNLIAEAKKNSDFVVVQIHWGNEYTKVLTDFQKNTGRFLIDNGADLVVGNHPHWIQDYEIYKDRYILYALGNFIFDQEWSKETKEGVIAKVIIQDKKVSNLFFTPTEIRNYGQVFQTDDFGIIPKEIRNE